MDISCWCLGRKSSLPALELIGSTKELFNCRLVDADVEAFVNTLISSNISIGGVYFLYHELTDLSAGHLARLLEVILRIAHAAHAV